MRTSEEIYHRVRWDPRFDPARFVLGVNVRGAVPARVPLPAFVPGGDIPWHRVLFIEADGELIWDRAAGVDSIDTTTAGRVRVARLLRPPFFTPGTPHAFRDGQWRPAQPAEPTRATLRVLTWNTLWDRYDSDRIDTARRRPLLLADLEAADADVIALQEVERPLLDALLAAPWVRAGYAVDVDPSRRDVVDTGLLLLSRLPVREAGRHALGPYKAVAAVTVVTPAGPLVVATTHLTSDHTPGGAQRRVHELTSLAKGFGDIDADLVVLGDFNDSGTGPQRMLGLRDAWTEVHGADDATPTFDPAVNPLAAVSSLTGRAGRLDRVLAKGSALRTAAATRLGDAATGLFVSDHYGVLVDLVHGDTRDPHTLDAYPTARTAIAWIPPAELAQPVQRIRQRHDPQADRWPPHVNVVFGFVAEADFERAVPLAAEAVAQVQPFTARLAGVRTFDHAASTTWWLDPAAADPAPWAALHAALARRFPRCAGRNGQAYVPHLTLGNSPIDQPPAPVTTTVGELVLLSRRGDEPMRPRATVQLGTGTVRWASESIETTLTDRRADLARRIAGRVTAALADGVVEVVGSRRMGCAGPDSDLDLVAAVPDATGVEARVRAAFPDAGRVRPVVGARVPGLRWEVDGLRVDLVVVESAAVPPAQALARRAELGDGAAGALAAISDADAVGAAVSEADAMSTAVSEADAMSTAVSPRHGAFAALARTVKAWARLRGLDSAPHGGLPGLAWAVLAARTVREVGDTPADFFGTWAAWDWRRAVALRGDAGPATTALTIRCPSDPVRSCTEQVSAGWLDLLTQELYEAWERGADGLWTPPPMHRRHAAWAVITVRGPDLEAAVGRVRGRTRALLSALEQAGVRDAHAWPRPVHSGQYVIGLGRTPPDAGALAGIARPWLAGLPEAEVAWAEGGAVPTLR